MEVTMLLCDAAQSVGGKLYILGGGFSTIHSVPGGISSMALAIKIDVPWDQTNRKVSFQLNLLNDDGHEVDLGAGAVGAAGDFEVGRPPGLKAGTEIDVPLTFPFPGMPLGLGGYVWQLSINGTPMARTAFRVLPAPGFSPDQFDAPEEVHDDNDE
jgi:hypothetical protein